MSKTAGCFVLLVTLFIPTHTTLAAGGALFLSPEHGTHIVGEKFNIQIYVDTGGVGASAAEAELTFDPTALSVERVSTVGSLIGSWVAQPSFSNTAGTVGFTGWLSQYYAGSRGLLLTITFTALRAATANIRFASGTILGAGTADSNIIVSMRSTIVSIQEEEDLSLSVLPPTPIIAVVPPPPPPAPTLTVESSTDVGTHFIIKGSTNPNDTVYVWLQENGRLPTSAVIKTGADGLFTYVSNTPAHLGTYSLWAQAEGSDGQKSVLSKKIILETKNGNAAATALAGGTVGMYSRYLALFLAGVLALGYFYSLYRTRDTRRYEA